MSTHQAIVSLREAIGERIVGQHALVTRMLIALLADGHILVEGPPGLAKTTAIKALAEGIEASFHRVQFTPDLLPADLTGTEIYRPQEGRFEFQRGPIFHNLLLADEINRAPAKVQSALLEAMAERQVTVGSRSDPLPPLFLVMATQNPLEQEGTYPLPEAQLDRFLMHVRVDYPSREEELAILSLVRRQAMSEGGATEDRADPAATAGRRISQQQLLAARQELLELHMAPGLERYLVEIVATSRNPGAVAPGLVGAIRYGASPRATLALDRCARAHAWLEGRDYVSPADIQSIAPDVLRHRLVLTFEAEAEGLNSDRVVTELLARVAVP